MGCKEGLQLSRAQVGERVSGFMVAGNILLSDTFCSKFVDAYFKEGDVDVALVGLRCFTKCKSYLKDGKDVGSGGTGQS